VVMSERLEKRPGATPTSFLPPTFAATTSISAFRVSTPPPQGNASGGLYIVIFRSGRAVWDEDGQHQRSEAQKSLGGATCLGARATSALLGLVPTRLLLVLQKVLMIKY
jgi:hypothetical protein